MFTLNASARVYLENSQGKRKLVLEVCPWKSNTPSILRGGSRDSGGDPVDPEPCGRLLS